MNFLHNKYLQMIAGVAILLSSINSLSVNAQDSTHQVVVPPLFEYPAAPDNIDDLQQRSDWLMQNFWKPFDFKSKSAVDQAALNHAFAVYAIAMQWASRDEVMKSTKALIKNIQKNPTLMLQFTKAAEESLYGQRASMWIDEVYIPYLEALVNNNKIDPLRKLRYADQLQQLSASAIGKKAPEFTFISRDGISHKYFPMSTFTIIEFGDPDCIDCQMAKLRLDANLDITRLVDEGRLNILFIIPDAESDNLEWAEQVRNYPKKWTVGATSDADENYDLRLTPAFYIVDGDGKIIAKNITADQAVKITTDHLMPTNR